MISIYQANLPMIRVFGAAIVAASSLSAAALLAQVSTEDRASYQILGPEGTVIGWQTERAFNDGQTQVFRRERQMRFTVDGHDPITTKTVITRRMDADKRPVSLDISSQINRNSQNIVVTFDGLKAIITRTREGQTRTSTTPYPTGLYLADPESLLRPLVGTFAVFDMSAMGFEVMSDTHASTGNPEISARVRTINDLPVEIWLREYDDQTAIKASTRPLLGSPIRFERLANGKAVPELSGSGRINHQMVPASYSISGNAKSGKIRYNFGLLEPLIPVIPQTGEQAVTITETGFRLDICRDCGPGLTSDEATLARYTLPTMWLQSDAPVFKKHGDRIAKRNLSDADKMRQLARSARGRLSRVDLDGHYSALDAWQRRAGDCTEDAVVLAALARASGIPALVASGIVYTRERYHGAANAFVPHSWVVAYVDGEWQSFDHTLEEGFDSTHIALTIGEGDARSIAAATQIAAMLEWQSMTEVRSRPKN